VPGGPAARHATVYFAGLQQQESTGSPVREQVMTPSFTVQQQVSTTVPVFSQTSRDPPAASVEDATSKARARLPRSFFIVILQWRLEFLSTEGRIDDQFRIGGEKPGRRSAEGGSMRARNSAWRTGGGTTRPGLSET
jgi:hypothetical protein